MGKYERSRRSIRWSVHKFASNGRGIKQGYIAQRNIEQVRWQDMSHYEPKKKLIYRLYSIHRINSFNKALADYVPGEESKAQKRYKRRLSLSLYIFRLTASFLLFFIFDRTSASVHNINSNYRFNEGRKFSEQVTNNQRSDGRHDYLSTKCMLFSIGNSFAALPEGKELKSGNETVLIEGYVTGDHHNNPIANTKIVLIRPDNNQRLDSVYTDVNGHYSKQWIVSLTGTSLDEVVENKAYPNPCMDEVNISFNASKNDKYQLASYSLEGKLVSDISIDFKQGNNVVNLKGGNVAPGVQIIRITNGEQKEDYKIIRTQSTNAPLEYEVTSVAPRFKSTTDGIDGVMVGQEIKLEFTAPATNYTNYLQGDTTFVVQASQTANKKLEQMPYNFTSTLKPFLETGEQISVVNPNWTTTIEWPDGETTTHSIVNQQIQLEKEMYPLNNTLGSIIMHHDTASYNVSGVENGVLNWIILREPHQKTNRPNIAQSESSNHMENVSYITEVPLDSLDNKLVYYYTIRKKAETQQGVYERLDSDFSRNLIEHSGSIKSSMFIDLKPFGVADSLDIVQKSWNETTGEQMSQADLDRSMNLLMQVLQTRYLPNGDTLLPPHRIYTITTNNDPRWQAVIARGGANSIKVTYTSGTPGNQRAWSNTHTYNGELRINYTGAFFNNVNNDAQIYEELISIVTGIEEGSGAMAPFIWNGTTNQPSSYAYSIAPIPGLLNLGTGQNVKSSDNAPRKKEMYNVNINGKEPMYFKTKEEMKQAVPELVTDF